MKLASFFLWVYAFITIVNNAVAQEALNYVQSLNYWKISLQIMQDEKLREILEIAPWQKAAIAEMRRSKEFEVRFFEELVEMKKKRDAEALQVEKNQLQRKSRQLIANEAMRQHLANIESDDDAALAAMNDVVKARMEKILTKSQMLELRPAALRLKFRSAFLPFADREVIEFCGITEIEQSMLDVSIEKHKKDYHAFIAKLQIDASRKIRDNLPTESRELMADYFGNDGAPEVSVRVRLNYDSIPIRKIAEPQSLLESTDLQEHIKLTAAQRESLEVLLDEYSRDLFLNPKDKSISRHFQELHTKMEQAIKKFLTIDQAIGVAQHFAWQEFLTDFSAPFSRPEVLRYLKLSAEDSRRIAGLAIDERNKLQKQIRELDRSTFDALASSLEIGSKQRIRQLFHGVWEIEH